MQKFIIDTDTASDDAVAIIMALRNPQAKVLALTCITGNVSMDTACKNAAIAAYYADTYIPPIYRGCPGPMLNRKADGGAAHGLDGYSGYTFDVPIAKPEKEHAVNAIIDLVNTHEDVQIIALGPLTNIAMALKKAPEIAAKIPRIVIMGGAGLGSGEQTPVAEANIWTDAEAADIVLRSGIPTVMLPLEACYGDTVINEDDQKTIASFGTARADFMLKATTRLRDFNVYLHGHPWISLPDPTAVAVALDESLIAHATKSKMRIDTKGKYTYGQSVQDIAAPENEQQTLLVDKLDSQKFKQLLFEALK